MEYALIAVIIAILALIGYVLYTTFGKDDKVVQDRLKGLAEENENVIDQYWQEKLEKPLSERLFRPLLDKLVTTVKSCTPAAVYKNLEKDVVAAGNFQGRGIEGFILYILGLVLGLTFLVLLYIYTRPADRPVGTAKAVIYIIGAIAFGFGFPIVVLKSMIEERQEEIRRAMPDVLDLLCVSVQAGMGFDGALAKVTDKMKGPLVDECDRLLQELRMGVTRRNALLRLSERCGIKEMQLFTAALIQAEKLGVGLAQVLEVQSENMREMRRQRAREKAAKMATKILFPLLVFIFPVIFVVALGPPLVTVFNSFIK